MKSPKKLSQKQLKKMGVKNYPMKKLSKKQLNQNPSQSPSPKSLRKQLKNLLMNLMLEPTLDQEKIWASKMNQRQWRQNRNQNLQ